jgi:hypothetical protein
LDPIDRGCCADRWNAFVDCASKCVESEKFISCCITVASLRDVEVVERCVQCHRGGSSFRAYSLPDLSPSLTRSSNLLSFRFLIHSRTIPKTTASMKIYRSAVQINHPIQAPNVLRLLPLHSRPVSICSLKAAISAVSFTIADSTFLLHLFVLRVIFPGSYSLSLYSSSLPSSRMRRAASLSSSCDMGLRTFMGPSSPLNGA